MPGEPIEVWHPAALPGVVLYRGLGVTHRYPRHFHDELHLCAYTVGDGRLRLRGATELVGAGDLVLTPAGEIHENWVDRGHACSFRSLYLDLGLLRGMVRQVTATARAALDFSEARLSAPRLRRALLQLHAAAGPHDRRLEVEGAFVELCRELVRATAAPSTGERRLGRERRAVRQAQAFLMAHQAQNVSLRQLSAVTGLSAYYLHRVFCRETGMPPHAYQLQLRINHAKQLMDAGLPLADIAAATGFTDQSHLTRHFRRLVGLPPGRFRRSPTSV